MQITLRSRITIIMIIFAVVLISAFTCLQLQNQLRVITIFNSLKAKLTAQILKDTLQDALKTGADEDPKKSLGLALESLRDSGSIDTAFVYSLQGEIEASTQSLAIGKKATSIEHSRVNKAIESKAQRKKFNSYIDKNTRNLQLYIPVHDNGNIGYVARLDISLGNIAEAMKQVYTPVIITAIVVAIATIVFGLMLSKRVIGPISLLNTATKEVAGGDLNLKIHMDTQDELEELADTFNIMATELKKMRARAENANPLTKLPGNIVIQEKAENRIKDNRKFTVIYGDLDNFKAYNDNYGIHAGDKVIELTASIFKEAAAQKGNPDDFVGHEGGDDFILLTTPDKAKDVGNYIISQLDKRIRDLYRAEDLKRGYIIARARHDNSILKFPILTISLSGVTNEIRPISSYGEITNIAAEVKGKVKLSSGSNFLIDRRAAPWPPEAPSEK